MFALQAVSQSQSQLGLALVGFLAFALLGATIGWVGSLLTQRLSNPVGKYRLLYAGVLVPFALLAYGSFALIGFGTTLVRLLPFTTGILDAVLAAFIELLAGGVVWLIAYAPTVRGVRNVRGIELSTTTALARMTRYVLGIAILVTFIPAALRLLPGEPSPLVVAIALSVFGIGLLVGSPWLIPALRSTARPTEATTARLCDLRNEAGLDVDDVVVLETDREETANASVRGPPGYRRLFVTSSFLNHFDDETVTALLSIHAGRARARVLPVRVCSIVVSGLFLVAAVTDGPGTPHGTQLGMSLLALVVGFWLSRRGIRAADDFAAERVGSSTVAAALERHADFHELEPTRRRFPNPFSVNVALGDRIDRLRGHTATGRSHESKLSGRNR